MLWLNGVTTGHKSRVIAGSLILAAFVLAESLLITACGSISVGDSPTATQPSIVVPTLTMTSTFTQSPSPTVVTTPSPTSVNPDTGWVQLQTGLERRVINLFDEEGNHLEQVYVLRLESEHYRFAVAYHPDPQTLEAWRTETDALIILNGGFYRVENETYLPNGLTVVDGEVIGSTYGPFAGMFLVTNDGPELRWLEENPYDPNEPLLAALQSFPVLVKPGGILGFPEEFEDYQQARRTVIGQDREGRLLFLIASKGSFTLHQLSSYLVASDFNLDIAINLDGGPSSGVLLSNPSEIVPALVPLPVVITVYDR
ncbi:MAG: hypothetical protein GTO18_08160 [Anaerolineales bacterium]|nr:hypothetical protein [Anaerolineales bacterium]